MTLFDKGMQAQEKILEMQEAMQDPKVQAQMSEMQAAMQNQELKQKVETLKDDPEFSAMFDDIQKNGMGALMKYMNDQQSLQKLGQRMGNLNVAPAAAAAASATDPAATEVNDLLDAARLGDTEAVDDFVAVGKDVNMQDDKGRSPLHYAAAHNQTRIARMLLDAGASTEVVDEMDNTVLHYAAGYGRTDIVDMLLEAGADASARNHTGKSAAAVARLNEKNPILQDDTLMQKLAV